MEKRNFLRECNEHGVPLEDFQAQFCSRCFQTECVISVAGKGRFDQRVMTWAERLYTQVPRLDPSDPRYTPIANQKFISIDVGRTPEIRSAWVDPLEARPADPAPAASPHIPEPPKPEPRTPGTTVPRHMVLANAPDQSGKMLGPAKPASPPRDPWATPEKPEGVVIRPGATVKLGGSGV